MPRGYRTWKLGKADKPEELRLTSSGPPGQSVIKETIWTPGTNVSSMTPEIAKSLPIKEFAEIEKQEATIYSSGPGFYSLSDPEKLIPNYYPGTKSLGGPVMGEIELYGKIVEGPEGYRSQGAEIATIYDKPPVCDICQQEKPVIFLPNAEVPAYLCKGCLKYFNRVIKDFPELSADDVIEALKEYYDVPVKPLPKYAIEARGRS